MRTCSIPDCNDKYRALDYCNKHLIRFKKYGDPLYITKEMHGRGRTVEYVAWHMMKHRCLNSNNKAYPHYGGRGITVCDRWLNSFNNFFEDMGLKPFPEAHLDRENNDKGYYKDNCRWVTPLVNARNQSNTKLNIDKAREIRKKYKTANITQLALSIEYNVCRQSIGYLLNNKTWVE